MIPKIIDTDKNISKGGRAWQDNSTRTGNPKYATLNNAKNIIKFTQLLAYFFMSHLHHHIV